MKIEIVQNERIRFSIKKTGVFHGYILGPILFLLPIAYSYNNQRAISHVIVVVVVTSGEPALSDPIGPM